MRSVRSLAGLVMASALWSFSACTCPQTFKTTRHSAPLIRNIGSFSTSEAVRGRVLSGHRFELVEKTPCREAANRPCFEVVVWKTDFEHLGMEGELWLTFFNDRLYGTMFYPLDFDPYLEQLAAVGLRLPRWSEPLRVSRNVLVWSGREKGQQPYVAWIDRRLLDESTRWIKCYGTAGDGEHPAPAPPAAEMP